MVNRDVHLLRTIVVDWSPNSGGSPEAIVGCSVPSVGSSSVLPLVVTLIFRGLIDWIQD